MGCFESLVKSKFLANVSSELSLARQAIRSMSQTLFPSIYYADKRDQKALYDEYVFQYYIIEEIRDTLNESVDPDMIYFLQYDHMMCLYSLKKSQVTDAAMYNYNIHGYIPIYRGRHRVDGFTMYTVLFDTRMSHIPFSPN